LADDFLPKIKGDPKVMGLAAGLGCAVVASLIGAIGLGIILDQWLDRTPLFTLIGVGVGLVAAGYQLYELVLVSSRDKRSGPIARTMADRMRTHRQEPPSTDN
jgi:F0F1-type ATP synthase assembly protein I